MMIAYPAGTLTVASVRYGNDAGDAQRAVPGPARRGPLPPALRRQAGVVREARRPAHVPARRGPLRARRPRRAVLRHRPGARRVRRPQARQGRLRRAGRQPHVHRRHRGVHRRADDQRLRGRRADGRDRVRPLRTAWHGRALAGVRRARVPHAARPAGVARGRGARRHAPDRRARLPAGIRGPRPARAQPASRALVRRRHRCRERPAARVARHPALGDPGARARHQRHAQPVRRAGRTLTWPTRRGRRRALRPRRARRRAGRAGGRGLRRLGGHADVRGRGLGARRPGRDQHADRELPRLPGRHLGGRADAQGDPPGPPLRRGAVELPPRRRAGRRARGPRARRPRRRPARPRPLRRDGDRSPLARADGRRRGPLPRRGRLPRGDGDRRRALPRRRRDRRRRRQLGRAGGGPPRTAGTQRARRGTRQGAEVDDVVLSRRPHREPQADRGPDRDGGHRGPRHRDRRVRQPAQRRRQRQGGAGDQRVRDDRRDSVHRGDDGDPRGRPRRLPAVRHRGDGLRQPRSAAPARRRARGIWAGRWRIASRISSRRSARACSPRATYVPAPRTGSPAPSATAPWSCASRTTCSPSSDLSSAR